MDKLLSLTAIKSSFLAIFAAVRLVPGCFAFSEGLMTKRKKKDVFESYYFTVDDWSREYRFEINRHRWEYDPNHHSERDEIRIAGRLGTKTKRKLITGEAHLLLSYVPRGDYSDEADRIGNAWIKDGRLYCSAFIPSDAYWSIPACLAAGKFVEMTMRIGNLHHNKGRTDSVGLDFELTHIEEEDQIDVSDELVQIDMKY